MPVVIYVFMLCALAIGFTEFISIGLASALAADSHASVSQSGLAVTFIIGAPLLTALAAGWSRKRLLLVAMQAFNTGNLLAACAIQSTAAVSGSLAVGVGT
ncbi:hypothetical protein [Pseudomonas sp. EL_65y_Pfl1_R32]|uniref:hypothetical protein n=1 Tax=Pseudomonas sp. EL_65y_Pfl1_R32 TaxID=3088696 RepID=UPI0030D8A4FB